MTISFLTRKALWANSGNLCAICRVDLIRDKKSLTNIGEECHIIVKKIDGPRGTPRNNEDIKTIVTIKDNWSLGNNGYIFLELYSSFNERSNIERFVNKINSVLP